MYYLLYDNSASFFITLIYTSGETNFAKAAIASWTSAYPAQSKVTMGWGCRRPKTTGIVEPETLPKGKIHLGWGQIDPGTHPFGKRHCCVLFEKVDYVSPGCALFLHILCSSHSRQSWDQRRCSLGFVLFQCLVCLYSLSTKENHLCAFHPFYWKESN